MRDILVVCALFVASVAVSDRLITRKLQSALGRVLVPYAAGLAIAFAMTGAVEPAALIVFWIGMLTAWFGVRSHLESSILLQMLIAVREHHSTRDEVLARCLRECGPAARTDELVHGGFLASSAAGLTPTRKGRLAARAAKLFR